MNINHNDSEASEVLPEKKELWLAEIVRETEHYYQGEMQHDQRASWLLATASILIAIVINLEMAALDKGYKTALLPLALALIAYILSGVFAVLTILPLRGIRFWKDIFGRLHRRDSQLGIDQLVEARFRHGQEWSADTYERRIKYHFRSHYFRSNLKAHGILWSSLFLLLGLLFFVAVGVDLIF